MVLFNNDNRIGGITTLQNYIDKPYLEKMLIWYVDLLKKHFEKSEELYKFEESLYHPAEYGRYREEAAREFIQFTLPGRLSTGEGFIISSKDESKVSTQCDIVVYDQSAPLFKDSHIRFFPIESVVAIGEVKSNLTTKEQVTDALIKLAKNKAMRKNIDSNSAINYREYHTDIHRQFYFREINRIFRELKDQNEQSSSFKFNSNQAKMNAKNILGNLTSLEEEYIDIFTSYPCEDVNYFQNKLSELISFLKKKREYEFNPNINHTDHIMSFLICNQITMKNKQALMLEINKAYDKNKIPIEDRHNMILSIKDGLFLYYDEQDKMNGNIYNWAFPKMKGTYTLKQRFIPNQTSSDKDLYYTFKIFARELFNGTSDVTILHPELAKHFNWEKEKDIDDIIDL